MQTVSRRVRSSSHEAQGSGSTRNLHHCYHHIMPMCRLPAKGCSRLCSVQITWTVAAVVLQQSIVMTRPSAHLYSTPHCTRSCFRQILGQVQRIKVQYRSSTTQTLRTLPRRVNNTLDAMSPIVDSASSVHVSDRFQSTLLVAMRHALRSRCFVDSISDGGSRQSAGSRTETGLLKSALHSYRCICQPRLRPQRLYDTWAADSIQLQGPYLAKQTVELPRTLSGCMKPYIAECPYAEWLRAAQVSAGLPHFSDL